MADNGTLSIIVRKLDQILKAIKELIKILGGK